MYLDKIKIGKFTQGIDIFNIKVEDDYEEIEFSVWDVDFLAKAYPKDDKYYVNNTKVQEVAFRVMSEEFTKGFVPRLVIDMYNQYNRK